MSAAPRPLRPRTLVWAALGIFPYLAWQLLPGHLQAVTWVVVGLEVAALLLLVLVVRRRRPVPWRRLASTAAFATLVLAILRFGVLQLVDPRRFGSFAGAPTLRGLGRLFRLQATVDVAFLVACLLLGVTCAHALWRARVTSGPGRA